jgi:hypothetical protein
MSALAQPHFSLPALDPAAVLAKATVRVAHVLGLNGGLLGKIIGLSEASISRLNRGERPLAPSSKEGELAALLVRLYRSLDALVGHDEKSRLAWLGSYNHALNGIPKELIQSAQGLVQVVMYLDAMRAPL